MNHIKTLLSWGTQIRSSLVANLITTHVGELSLIRSLEVPVDRGLGGHLAPHLTGDAAQFEAFVGHRLCV